jgi:hypothetical protein
MPQGNETVTNSPTVRSIATFTAPFAHGIINGRVTRILALGDQEGKSPVYLCVDTAGKSSWQSAAQVQILDPNFLPSEWLTGPAGKAATEAMATGYGR